MTDKATWGIESAACGAHCDCCARAERVAQARNGALWGMVLFSLGCLVMAAWCVGVIGHTVEQAHAPAVRSALRLADDPGRAQ